MEVYPEIVVGDGPVGRVLVNQLTQKGRNCLVLDAGKGLMKLRENLEVHSNINYVAHIVAPSLNKDSSEYAWAGGCQGWPIGDYSKNEDLGLPIEPNSETFIKTVDKLNRMLGIKNFDFLSSKPRVSINKDISSRKLSFVYCKILSDPFLTKLQNVNLASSKVSYQRDFILERVIPDKDYITLTGSHSLTGEPLIYKCEKLTLSLGTIENTRVLLNSRKELNLHANSFLGRYLSDHLALKYAKIYTRNLPRVIRYFSRPRTFDGHRIWPRLVSGDEQIGKVRNTFVHVDQFAFDGKIPIIFRVLRRLGQERFYFSRKRGGTFDLNIFAEKTNEFSNRLETDKISSNYFPKMKIYFFVGDEEVEQLKMSSEYWKTEMTQLFGADIFRIEIYPKDETLRSLIHAGSHPSGSYRMSTLSESGVTNKNSELWEDSRIRVVGAGTFPRASTTHPTYTAMVLALLRGD